MLLRAFKNIGDQNPIVAQVSVVLIEQDDGTAISVACEMNGIIHVSHCNDPDFNRVLQTLGFDKLTIVENVADMMSKPDELPKIIG